MILLKIGGVKHLNQERWQDALQYFDMIYCFCLFNEERLGESDRIKYIQIKRTIINRLFFTLLRYTREYKILSFFHNLVLRILSFHNRDTILAIEKIEYTHTLSSYCDYDHSDILTLLISKTIKVPIVRAYKETRPKFNYFEKRCFKICDKIILNANENKVFFEEKYGTDFFGNKQLVIGWDENVMANYILESIEYQEKNSKSDGKLHAVILAGRVFSSLKDKRSGSRLYYLNLIKELNNINIVVHLHTAKIFKDENGIDQYRELEKNSNGMFIIEKSLNFKDNCKESCEYISRYDIGVLHNFVEGSSVSQFDRVNLPHRLYEYQASHVIPILKKNSTVVLEELFTSNKCGFLYDNLSELNSIKETEIKFLNTTYSDYIREVIVK